MSEKSDKFRATFRAAAGPTAAVRVGTPALPRPLEELLHRVSRLDLRTKLRIFPALLVSIFSIVWLVQALVDRYFRLSWETRAVLLAIQAAVVLFLLWKHVLVPLSQKLDRRRSALLIERGLPEFDSSLISVVEFCETPDSFPHHAHSVVRKLIDQVARRTTAPGLEKKVVDSSAARQQEQRALGAAAFLLLCIVLAGLPVSWTLGKRIFLSRDPLPGDTALIAATGDFTVDAGTDATLTVRALGVIPPLASLKIRSASGSSTIPVNLTQDGKQSLFSYTVKNVREDFTYQFEANDGESNSSKVTVNIPPHLESIRFVQTYPPYTGLPETEMSAGSLRLLEGSSLRIAGKASESLRAASLLIPDQPDVRMSLAQDRTNFGIDLEVPDRGWKSFSVHLNAGDSRKSSNEPVYRVEIVNDRPPVPAILLPKKDRMTLTPGSKIPLTYKVSDDFGLSRVDLCYRVEEGGTPNSFSFAEKTKSSNPLKIEPGKSLAGGTELDLANLLPRPEIGSTVYFWIEARDNNGLKGPSTAASKEKAITVVSEAQKRMELLELMSQRAKDIEKLYEQQRDVNRKADDSIRASRKP
ncbi:hypothetical protein [Luteolibacter sp. Populi]|uniref:hypothetical protein n=1 Tax=Luteolibacter sp. Populi TaxID=3230487 RepID=UPI003466D01C